MVSSFNSEDDLQQISRWALTYSPSHILRLKFFHILEQSTRFPTSKKSKPTQLYKDEVPQSCFSSSVHATSHFWQAGELLLHGYIGEAREGHKIND